MEWERDLRRSQSLRSLSSSGDKSAWTEGGLRDKIPSVSQLVARYQTFSQSTPGEQTEGKTKKVFNEVTSFPPQNAETHLESLMRRNEERERVRVKTSLTRSKSVGSLQNNAGSIEALKALFESNAPAQKRVKSNFKPENVALSYNAETPVMILETEDVQRAAEEQRKPAQNKVKRDTKEDHVTQKVVKLTPMERRKTVAGIDFERIAASEADEKRRSIADFRDSSFIQTKETLSVSVKAMSALYMSKVANQDSINSPAKVEQDQSLEPGKKVKLTKMKEDSRQTTDDLPPLPPERLEAGIDDQQLKPSQLSKQMLYQQRQKSELKRLLKHTHPELKMLDDVVDEELAEVLSSEGATVGENGYEGEVLSRCLIFENCGSSTSMSPYTTKIHMAHDTEERCDCSKTPGVSEKLREGPVTEGVKGMIEKENDLDLGPNCDEQTEEEMIKVNVQATRRMFESQSRPNPDGIQENVSVSLNKGKIGQKPTKQSGSSSREKLNNDRKVDLEAQSQEPCGHFGQRNQEDQTGNGALPNDETSFEWDSISSPESESQSEKIQTSAALFQNNPFMLTNIEKENSYGQTPATQTQNNGAGEDHLVSNVKSRTHLFESMPFDKIRHQNRDEIETMVENIKETLNFLFCVKAIQSAGTIIEVNETMIAKKAKFTLTDGGPELQYDEVAEGGAQNFIVQLLPRVNLKPQITYLKEDSQGSMEATVVDVLVHQQRFNTKKDTEVKTANVVQLVEDILNQDNSLRKGVIIQKDVDNCEEVIVYSLYKYFDEEDVKSYSPLKTAESETETGSTSTTDDEETRRGLRSLQEAAEDQSCSESVRPYLKVNVKLFKSCIERGDLEYLKSLQEDEPTAQAEDSSHNQTAAGQDKESNHEESRNLAEESDSEYVPVDVKRLKRMFSEDKSPVNRSCIKSVNMSNASSGKRQSSAKCNTEASSHQQQVNIFKEYGGQKHEEVVPQDDDNVHQAEVAEVVEDADEIFDLRSAIQNLQQMTKEAKSLYQSSMQKSCNEEPSKTAETPDDVEPSRKETELPRGNMDLRVESGWEQKNTETRQEEQTAEVCCKSQECTNSVQSHLVSPPSLEKPPAPEEEEDVFQGKIQAALDSLEKSNVNVTKGDFRAAMIYRNSSKSHQGLSQNNENLHTKELCPMTKPKSTQTLAKQDVSRSADESNTGSVSKKRPAGPKPPVPPKPEHLKLKQAANLPTVTINQEETEIKSIKVTVPQVQSSTSDKEQHLFKSSNESMMGHQGNELLEEDKQMSQEPDEQHQAEGSKDESVVSDQQEINATGQEISSQRAPGNDHTNETGEIHIGLCEECQKREGTKTFSAKTTPAKPKRQKGPYLDRNPPDERVNQRAIQVMADQSSDARGITPESEGEPTKDMRQENKVEMREKKGGTETEDQR